MLDPISFTKLNVINLGPMVSKGGFAYNSYLFKSIGKTFLIDIPPAFHYDVWLASINKQATFSALSETGAWGSQNRQGFQKTTTK